MSQGKVKYNGETYKMVVMQVLAKDPHGRPTEVKLLYDEQKVKVEDGAEFLTVFMPAFAVKKVTLS